MTMAKNARLSHALLGWELVEQTCSWWCAGTNATRAG